MGNDYLPAVPHRAASWRLAVKQEPQRCGLSAAQRRSLKGIMAKETILIGCRLPNGLVLHHPKNRNLTVKLEGTYAPKTESGLFLPPRPYSITTVDAEFWAEWKAAYAGFPPLKTRAVFEARSEQEAESKAKNAEKVKTGFEPMSKSVTIDGIKLEQAEN